MLVLHMILTLGYNVIQVFKCARIIFLPQRWYCAVIIICNWQDRRSPWRYFSLVCFAGHTGTLYLRIESVLLVPFSPHISPISYCRWKPVKTGTPFSVSRRLSNGNYRFIKGGNRFVFGLNDGFFHVTCVICFFALLFLYKHFFILVN